MIGRETEPVFAERWTHGDPPARRLQSDQPGARCRDADRTATIACMGHGNDACRDAGRRAAGRAARCVVGIPWIPRLSVERALGGCGQAEFGAGRLGKDHKARLAIALGQRCIFGRYIVPEGARAVGHWLALQLHAEVLGGKRHALEGPICEAVLQLLAGRAFKEAGEAIDLVLCGRAGFQRCVEQFLGRDLAPRHQLGQSHRVVFSKALHRHLPIILSGDVIPLPPHGRKALPASICVQQCVHLFI